MSEPEQRLDQMLRFLEMGTDNVPLIAETAEVALDAGELDLAARLTAQLVALAPEHGAALPLRAMIALRFGRFEEAADLYGQLAQVDDTPAVIFNRAWAFAMMGAKSDALVLLDEECSTAIASAAMLRIQILHEQGEFEGATAIARRMLPIHGDDEGFAAAVGVLALDIEDIDLARSCAARGGNHPDALSTRGLLGLNEGQIEYALTEFDQALNMRNHHPRAWIGRGLAKLARMDAVAAAADIDRGAEQFGDHIGSWIAAGWAFCGRQHRDRAAAF
jgi:Flp pilus assembly protein TadD